MNVPAGTHPVEAAIAAGKIPPSRRDHYMKLHAKRPKATAKLLDELEAVLPPPDETAALASGKLSSPEASVARTGPTDYPSSWLRPGEVGASRQRQAEAPTPRITFEDGATAAAMRASSPAER